MQQRPVEQAHVVGGDATRWPGPGVLEAVTSSQKKSGTPPVPCRDKAEPQAPTTTQHSAEAQHAERREQAPGAHAGRLQARDDRAAAQHVGGIHHVDRGDHARAPLGRRPHLHGGHRRHHVEPAGDGEPAQSSEHRKPACRRQHRRRAHRRFPRAIAWPQASRAPARKCRSAPRPAAPGRGWAAP